MPEAAAPDCDVEALARIHAAAFTTPAPWSAAEIAGFLSLPHAFLLSRPQGFLIGTAVAGEAELVTLAVDPPARRQGHATALVAAFLRQARALGAETAFLEVAAENPAAIAVYESQGFVCTGRRPGYYRAPDGKRGDALIMSRALD